MKLFSLKIVSAVAIDGVIHRAGAIVTVAEKLAIELLRRGKAVANTVAETAEHLVAEDVESDASQPDPEPTEATPAASKGKGKK